MATKKMTTTTRRTANAAGSAAYSLPDQERLVTGVLTCFFNEPKHYGDTSKEIVEAARRVIATDPEFVAKLACFARNEFHMRTISQVLAAEVAHGAKGNRVIRKMTRKVIERPDDMTNILAYHFDTWGPRKDGNPVPRGLRRGLADIFGKFDEYQLAKYKGDGDLVKLRDALLIVRPKPENAAQGALWKKLIEGNLATPETRETILSEKGQSKETWESFIDSGKMGYFAMVRNLGNFLKNGISDAHWAKVLTRLADPKAVEKSKLVPFEFYKAYKFLACDSAAIRHSQFQNIRAALESAIQASSKNLPRLPGTTYMTADESGSMSSPLAQKSNLQLREVGNLLMAISDGFCDKAIVTCFGDTTAEVRLNKTDGVLKKMQDIETVGSRVGQSTMLNTAIADLNKRGEKVDRIIVFSDMQAYDNSLGHYGWIGRDGKKVTSVEAGIDEYRRNINPDVWVHSIDLAGQGTIQAKGPKVNLIAGWSDKSLEFIKLAEDAQGSLIDRIKNYEI
jgi:hypothetical protein